MFWVSSPDDPDTPAASFVKCFNPHSEKDLAFWRRLADQSHWHMFLMVGNDMRDYIWYGDFELNEKLDAIIANRGPASRGDFAEAEEIFRQQSTAEDLLDLPDGRYSSWVLPRKS